jgi:hypothetical protein
MAGSSANGMPALTSSMWAPAATWASASDSTRLKSPFFISSASSLRPVGLMRSPMITKGRSNPMTTSLVAELTMVSVMGAGLSYDHVRGSRTGFGSRLESAVVPVGRENLAGEGLLDALDLEGDLEIDVVATRAALTLPLGEVVVGAEEPGVHGRPVDRAWNLDDSSILAVWRPFLAVTWAGMSRHEMIVRVGESSRRLMPRPFVG